MYSTNTLAYTYYKQSISVQKLLGINEKLLKVSWKMEYFSSSLRYHLMIFSMQVWEGWGNRETGNNQILNITNGS